MIWGMFFRFCNIFCCLCFKITALSQARKPRSMSAWKIDSPWWLFSFNIVYLALMSLCSSITVSRVLSPFVSKTRLQMNDRCWICCWVEMSLLRKPGWSITSHRNDVKKSTKLIMKTWAVLRGWGGRDATKRAEIKFIFCSSVLFSDNTRCCRVGLLYVEDQ